MVCSSHWHWWWLLVSSYGTVVAENYYWYRNLEEKCGRAVQSPSFKGIGWKLAENESWTDFSFLKWVHIPQNRVYVEPKPIQSRSSGRPFLWLVFLAQRPFKDQWFPENETGKWSHFPENDPFSGFIFRKPKSFSGNEIHFPETVCEFPETVCYFPETNSFSGNSLWVSGKRLVVFRFGNLFSGGVFSGKKVIFRKLRTETIKRGKWYGFRKILYFPETFLDQLVLMSVMMENLSKFAEKKWERFLEEKIPIPYYGALPNDTRISGVTECQGRV